MKPRRLLLLLLSGLSVLIIAGGSVLIYRNHLESITDRSFVSQSPCKVPCWQGITPGVTTDEQALSILRASPYVDQDSIRINDNPTEGGVLWHPKSPYPIMVDPGLDWKNSIVEEVSVTLSFKYTIAEVISQYGPPETLVALDGGLPDYPEYYIILLYYPSLNTKFSAYTAERNRKVEPTTEVRVVFLFSPTRGSEVLHPSRENVGGSVYFHFSCDWKGYGDLRVDYDKCWED